MYMRACSMHASLITTDLVYQTRFELSQTRAGPINSQQNHRFKKHDTHCFAGDTNNVNICCLLFTVSLRFYSWPDHKMRPTYFADVIMPTSSSAGVMAVRTSLDNVSSNICKLLILFFMSLFVSHALFIVSIFRIEPSGTAATSTIRAISLENEIIA
jgi:hypothetical protein